MPRAGRERGTLRAECGGWVAQALLKPHFHKKKIDKAQYKEIVQKVGRAQMHATQLALLPRACACRTAVGGV
jgi:hypothetical protein